MLLLNRATVLPFALTCLLASPALSNFDLDIGTSYYELCNKTQDGEKSAGSVNCISWIAGLTEGHTMIYVINSEKAGASQLLWCTEGVIYGQYFEVLMAFLEKYPEQRHNRTAAIAYFAFKQAWPCASTP